MILPLEKEDQTGPEGNELRHLLAQHLRNSSGAHKSQSNSYSLFPQKFIFVLIRDFSWCQGPSQLWERSGSLAQGPIPRRQPPCTQTSPRKSHRTEGSPEPWGPPGCAADLGPFPQAELWSSIQA